MFTKNFVIKNSNSGSLGPIGDYYRRRPEFEEKLSEAHNNHVDNFKKHSKDPLFSTKAATSAYTALKSKINSEYAFKKFQSYDSLEDAFVRFLGIFTYPALCVLAAVTVPLEGCFHLGMAIGAGIKFLGAGAVNDCGGIEFHAKELSKEFRLAFAFTVLAPVFSAYNLAEAVVSFVWHIIDFVGSVFTTIFGKSEDNKSTKNKDFSNSDNDTSEPKLREVKKSDNDEAPQWEIDSEDELKNGLNC